MSASLENPIYTTYIVSGGTKYNISPVVTSLEFSDQRKQISKRLTIVLRNAQTNGSRLAKLLNVRDRVYVYANDGERNDEVFRGFVWTRSTKDQLDGETLTLKCYDNLIYFQESEESEYFSSGKSTSSIISTLCGKWGVSLEYTYSSITHSKMALRGTLSDIITSDILDLVKARTGKKYVIISEKDIMKVRTVGTNSTVYNIKERANAEGFASELTMDGMVTKVVILGKADDDDRRPVEATVSGQTSKYGTLQKIINRDTNTSLSDAKKEAQSIINEDGYPKAEYSTKCPDIPWIRKGDKVKLSGQDGNKYCIVVGIDRDITNKAKTMSLTLEDV